MTEQEWLTSEDPQAMLAWAKSPNVDTVNKAAQCEANRRLGDRKLRLWVEACRQRAGVSDHFDIYNAGLRLAVAYWCSGDGLPLSHADRAALLRDIAGNPWRPVTLPKGRQRCQACGGKGWRADTTGRGTTLSFEDGTGTDITVACVCSGGWVDGPCPWLTPTVLGLAQAAHDERLPDGTLDPVRLAILADALEEAGCPPQPPGRTRAEVARLRTRYAAVGGCCDQFADNRGCGCFTSAQDEGLLAHLRSEGPHVRGDWAVDLVLGKE